MIFFILITKYSKTWSHQAALLLGHFPLLLQVRKANNQKLKYKVMSVGDYLPGAAFTNMDQL